MCGFSQGCKDALDAQFVSVYDTIFLLSQYEEKLSLHSQSTSETRAGRGMNVIIWVVCKLWRSNDAAKNSKME